MSDAVRASCLIVNYQCGDYLEGCLRTLFTQLAGRSFEVIVADNASTDGSVAAAKALGLPVRWLLLPENVGFARANNIAAKEATGKFLVLLNPDTELYADCLNPLLDYIEEHPEVGLVGGHHEDAKGAWQRSFGLIPTLWQEFEYALTPQTFWGRLPSDPPVTPVEVGWLFGSFVILRRSLAEKIGLFDERFFLNDEDVDLADRVHTEGLKIMYHPARGLRHYGGVSKLASPTSTREYYRARRAYYRARHGYFTEGGYIAAHHLRQMRDTVALWFSRRRMSA